MDAPDSEAGKRYSVVTLNTNNTSHGIAAEINPVNLPFIVQAQKIPQSIDGITIADQINIGIIISMFFRRSLKAYLQDYDRLLPHLDRFSLQQIQSYVYLNRAF